MPSKLCSELLISMCFSEIENGHKREGKFQHRGFRDIGERKENFSNNHTNIHIGDRRYFNKPKTFLKTI